jgi:hypothetical protein
VSWHSRHALSACSSLLVLAVSTSVPVVAQVQTVQRGWRVSSQAEIKVHAPSGTLLVQGWDRDSVDLRGELVAGESTFGGGSLTGLKLGVEGVARGGASRLVVRLPHSARLVVRSGAAAVTVQGVDRSIDVGSATGDIEISGAIESVTAESISGSVHIAGDIPLVRARTSTGDLEVAGQIRECVLTTVSGSVDVSGVPNQTVRVNSVDGPVSVRGPVAARGSLSVETFGGRVQIRLPFGAAAALDLRASGASISGEIESADRRRTALSQWVTPLGSGVELRRTIGSAGGAVPSIVVRTLGGSITVTATRREP